MPRESLDAPDNLPKQALRQVAFGQLEDEVPRMPDEGPAGLEQPLLETHQGPALDGDGQDQSAQQIAEVVGDDPEEQPDLIGPEPMTGEAGPVVVRERMGHKARFAANAPAHPALPCSARS
jgi:hypothetical protein